MAFLRKRAKGAIAEKGVQPKPIKMSFVALAAELMAMPRQQSTLLVGVDGAGGAGKSTFARLLKAAFASLADDTMIVHMDDFFFPTSRQNELAADGFVDGTIDWKRLLEQVLVPIKEERPGRYQRYDWPSRTLQEWHIVGVGGIVIVEGIRALRRELAPIYDQGVWITCPRSVRLDRGIARDGEKARRRWELDWMPAEDRYIEQHRPQDVAELVVDGSGESGIDFDEYFVALITP